MKLAPPVIQSMEILQMPLAELRERIEQELESNPTLELAEFTADGPTDPDLGTRDGAMEAGDGSEGFDRLDEFTASNPDAAENAFDGRMRDDYEPRGRVRDTGERDGKMDAMAQAPARAGSLGEQMMDQWALCDVTGRVRAMGEAIINQLDEDGYLRASFDEIALRESRLVRDLEPTEADWELALPPRTGPSTCQTPEGAAGANRANRRQKPT